ncbi:MAG: AEC family transporter [Anaerolineae bacterium]|nr:AEC family transporter [Anaerolineae bacterium]
MLPLHIFYTIVLPIFIIIGVGYLLDKVFELDIATLTKVLFYVISPVITFNTLVGTELGSTEIFYIGAIVIIYQFVMYAISHGIFSLKPFRKDRPVLACSSTFFNSGNYGFPFMLLAFGERGLEVAALVIPAQALILFSLGLISLSGERSLKESAKRLIKVPILYALVLGLIVRLLNIPIPEVLTVPLKEINNGMVPLALITLGAQLSRSKIDGNLLPIASASTLRLLVGPLAVALIALLMDVPRDLTAMLIAIAGLPTAVNIFILSKEFGKSPELASQMVFWTTLLSAISLPLLLIVVR